MKLLIASVLLVAPLLALAATPTAVPKKTATATKSTKSTKATKPVTKPAAKPSTTARKSAAVRTTKQSTGSRAAAAAGVVAGGAAVATGAGPLQAGHGLPDAQMAIAERVYTGRIACELGQFVNVARDAANPGYFHVTGNGFKFHMAPVGTSTGVVRLEDTKAGAVWLQIANKSMLMNHKAGQRLADACMSPEQLQVAEAIKQSPPPSLLESPPGK